MALLAIKGYIAENETEGFGDYFQKGYPIPVGLSLEKRKG
jgi:hypothetical protein